MSSPRARACSTSPSGTDFAASCSGTVTTSCSGSRNEKPLTRYFPELVESLRANVPDRCVLDGEIVIAGPTGLDFDALPSGSIPPSHGSSCWPGPRRPRSWPSTCWPWATPTSGPSPTPSAAGAGEGAREGRSRRSTSRRSPPARTWPGTGSRGSREPGWTAWWSRPATLPYQPDKRVMLKVKHERTADCVVGGFRWHKAGGVVGSLLLGLFDDDGVLHHVGVASGFSAARREEFVEVLEPYRDDASRSHPWLAEGAARRSGPGRPEPLERRQGSQLGAAAARARGRGGLRPPPGRPIPPRHLVRSVATGPGPGVVHLRPARHARAHRAGGGLRDRRLTAAQPARHVRRPARRAPGPGGAGILPRRLRSVPATGGSRRRRARLDPRRRVARSLNSSASSRWPASRSASLAAPRTESPHVGIPVADVVGDLVDVPVVGQHHRGRALSPSGQPGKPVGGVPDQGQPVGDRSGGDAELGPDAVLVA